MSIPQMHLPAMFALRAAVQRTLLAVVVPATLAFWTVPAIAEDSYPNRPIHLVVPFAGGVTDKVSRVFGERLEAILKQPIVVETKAGGSGVVGTRWAAQQPADGYTLLVGSDGLSLNAALASDDTFDPARDLTPIAPIVSFPFLLVTSVNKPYRDLRDLVTTAKAAPGRLNYATNGVSTGSSLMGEALKSETGTDIVPIPYKGGSEQALALISGDVDYAFLTTAFVQPYIRDGALKPLAIATHERSAAFTDVPTVSELGYTTLGKGFTWFALFAPKGLPDAIRARLEAASGQILADPSFRKTLAEWDGSPIGTTSQDLAELLRSQTDLYVKQLAELPAKQN
ncbi:Bug family tripartite tricarboxylate transporter substrate binding protein [Inquilinus limosus]|uniref:ABC transporter substrate-binding protein n=1 Tax=Inquilinus limosus TaxID=171674 RepID=A0A211ZV59_9PROT|nr:tripartite tricarboxylate transporter substrate binding protein [Inquilinus limosus]OWJ69171.1 hypothetical protein BWR60_01170 [Inquilinus limosus]